jgi:hypothetical protein
MPEEVCPGCRVKDRRIAELERFMEGLSAVIDVALGPKPGASDEGPGEPDRPDPDPC